MDWDRGADSGAKSIAGPMGLSDCMIYIEIGRARRNREGVGPGAKPVTRPPGRRGQAG